MSGWVQLDDDTWENVQTGDWMEIMPSFDGVKIKIGTKDSIIERPFVSNREAEKFIFDVVLGKKDLNEKQP